MNKIRNKIKLLKKEARWCLVLALVAVVAVGGGKIALAEWHEPASPPVVEQFWAPISTDSQNQAKTGRLLLDPTYNPREGYSLDFSIEKNLAVKGTGAKFSVPNLYSDVLRVATDTLYADSNYLYDSSYIQWVGIGTDALIDNDDGVKLKIVGGTVTIGTPSAAITGRALSGDGSSIGVYGETTAEGSAGVYGYRDSSDGWAVKGESSNNLGALGQSDSGYGIYASTENDSETGAAVYGSNSLNGWAGYFDGSLGSVGDMVADRFLPTKLQRSLVSYTAGWREGPTTLSGMYPDWGDQVSMAFDGTYVWIFANSYVTELLKGDVFQIRAADGQEVGMYNFDTPSNDYVTSAVFDGEYLWAGTRDGYVIRMSRDFADVQYKLVENNSSANIEALAVAEVNGEAFILATVKGFTGMASQFAKISRDLSTVDKITMPGPGSTSDVLKGVVFDGEYAWILVYNTTNPPGHRVCSIKVSDLSTSDSDCYLAAQTAGSTPHRQSIIFDGKYIWILDSSTTTNETVVRFLPDDPLGVSRLELSVHDSGCALPRGMTFDGDNIWIAGAEVADTANGCLIKIPAAVVKGVCANDPNISCYEDATCGSGISCVPDNYEAYITSDDYVPETLLFDGTYLWNAEIWDAGANRYIDYVRFYSGTGMGHTDINSVVRLDYGSTQTGNINVTESSAVGADAIVSGDVQVGHNEWGGSDVNKPISSGIAECDAGQFIKGVTLNVNSEISAIICRKL